MLRVNNDIELIKKYLPEDKWESSINKLKEGYPVQYIIGNVDFYNCLINVNENVLIPRFETEYLVQDLISLMKETKILQPDILDIGTGSGAIAIALKKNYPCFVSGIDISKEAITLARENAHNNHTNLVFLESSIEEFDSNIQYDVIVSNPPYVLKGEYVDEKTKYEPQNAIFVPNNDGLYFYKIILEKSLKLLKKPGIIAFEIGEAQKDSLYKLSKEYYPNAKIIQKKDLNNLDRYLYIINE